MDTVDYEKACLDILTNTEFHKELSYDANDQYKKYIGKEIDQLKQTDYITDFEHSTLNEVNHSPLFYDFLKLHKVFTLFPPFLSICRGSNSRNIKIIRMDWLILNPIRPGL